MPQPDAPAAPLEGAGHAGDPKPLHVYAAGLWLNRDIARILRLAGLVPVPGHLRTRPGPGDLVGVWGRSPYAARGERVAAATGAGLVRIEDAFLRSVLPGRARGARGPLGLLIDRLGGVHFDPSAPSALEDLLARHPLDETPLLTRARDGMARLAALRLSKYNTHDPACPAPPPGYVLVIDQTQGDAAIGHGRADAHSFRAMLAAARDEHLNARIVIRAHPETMAALRPGHFDLNDAQGRISLCTDPVAPHDLLEGAIAVYTVSSQMGFEAILAGHRPQVFGQPFYAGWGLTEDRGTGALPRRGRRLSRAQLFAGAMILAPVWVDPCRGRLCSFEAAVDQLEAEVRAMREDRAGHVATGMRLWKRRHLQGFFGTPRAVRFADPPETAARAAVATGRGLLIWSGTDVDDSRWPEGVTVRRVEDGFLRSRGLGAQLVPPLSLVADDLGIYYDPTRASRLERLIAAPCPPWAEARGTRLIEALAAAGVTKYNLAGTLPALPDLPPGRRILVPGQVEDDASIRLGARDIATNLALLERVRAENRDAVVIWKPHPDVEAGLRPGAVPPEAIARLADVTLSNVGADAALRMADEVWTLTSGLGFEALLRGLAVTCLGVPFYAGWGLTRDLAPVPARRQARPSHAALAHAVLVAYPRYRDPVSALPCPPEVVIERLAGGTGTAAPPRLRALARLQGWLAGHAHLWRDVHR